MLGKGDKSPRGQARGGGEGERTENQSLESENVASQWTCCHSPATPSGAASDQKRSFCISVFVALSPPHSLLCLEVGAWGKHCAVRAHVCLGIRPSTCGGAVFGK